MTKRLVSLVAIAGSLALTACIPPAPEPTPAPTPSPVAQPSVAPTQVVAPTYDNWMDAPQTVGNWTYRAQGSTTQALFGEASQGARVVISCDRTSRRVTIARSGMASGQVDMLVRTETQDRTLTAGAVPGQEQIAVQLAASDPLLDAIAFSRGRFALGAGGQQTLYLPAYPEITRVVEDCRG